MQADRFLEQWVRTHIDAGSQQSDATKLADELVADAARQGVGRDVLERVAGAELEQFLVGAIRDAVEQHLR
jgi:hypothetical protein